jgi:C4-dicarboxylate transporter DctM subunit
LSEALEIGGTLRESRRPALLFDRVTSLLNSLGTFWVFCLIFLICADVVARNLFNAPIYGVAEMVGYSIVAAVYLQLAHTLHVGALTRAEMVIGRLEAARPIAAAVFNIVFDLVSIAVFALIAYGAYDKLLAAWPDLQYGNPEQFAILVWPLYAIIMLGAALTVVAYGLRMAGALRSLRRAIADRLRARAAPVGWGALAGLGVVLALFAATAFAGLPRVQIGILSFAGIIILICLGIHIAVGLIALGVVGMWIMMGDPTLATNAVKITATQFLRNYDFGVIPLFVLMGLLVSESGIGKDTFDVARWLTRPIRGGLGVATVMANAVFAAITGSSIASAAVFTRVAAPQMLSRGYSPRFSVGTVAGTSVLGMLIPPSLLLIVYSFLSETSVGALFLAAVIPGLVLALAMAVAIIGMAHFWPAFVGNPSNDDLEGEHLGSAALKLLPIIILITIVLGGIYSGIVAPVEAGAVGALGALVIALAKRGLTWRRLWNAMVETGHISVAILFLILAAKVFSQMLTLSGLPQQVGELITHLDLGFYGFMAVYVVTLIILGMFLDSVSIMLIIMPLVVTLVQSFGADLVWFGIVTVIAVEMGLLTPPLGLSCFVVKSALGDDRVALKDIFVGSFPFVVIMLMVTILLIVAPKLAWYR